MKPKRKTPPIPDQELSQALDAALEDLERALHLLEQTHYRVKVLYLSFNAAIWTALACFIFNAVRGLCWE